MTTLHAGGKFDDNAYKVSGGLHGVGVSVVNALSDVFVNSAARSKGLSTGISPWCSRSAPLKEVGATGKRGTECYFAHHQRPFTTSGFNTKFCQTPARACVPEFGVAIHLNEEKTGKEDIFLYEGGLSAFVSFLNQNKTPLNDVFHFSVDREDGIGVEIAMQWNDTFQEQVHTYTNNIPQGDGGTHLAGFRAALTRTLNTYIERENMFKKAQKHHRR